MGFFTGIQLYGKAFGILFSRKFWWFLLFPVIILLLLFIGGNILISLAGDSLYGLIEAKLTAWVGGISWLQWVTTTTSVLIKIVLRILYFFLFVAFGGYIVLVVMSPVYSWLSERTEAHLTGREFPFSFRQFAWEIFRGNSDRPEKYDFSVVYFFCIISLLIYSACGGNRSFCHLLYLGLFLRFCLYRLCYREKAF